MLVGVSGFLGVLMASMVVCAASCGRPDRPDIRLFTGGKVEIGYRRDGDPYRRLTFDKVDRPDQIRVGPPTRRLIELAIMMPDGTVERVDEPTLRRIEMENVQIRIFDNRVEYAEPEDYDWLHDLMPDLAAEPL